MTLLELITYCKLKGYVKLHREVAVTDWDVDARHFEVTIQGRGYAARIRYAVIGESAALMNAILEDCGTRVSGNIVCSGTEILRNAELKDIVKAFVPHDA